MAARSAKRDARLPAQFRGDDADDDGAAADRNDEGRRSAECEGGDQQPADQERDKRLLLERDCDGADDDVDDYDDKDADDVDDNGVDDYDDDVEDYNDNVDD